MILRRVQHLRISLAAKCQLLFGAAVLLIIAAALFVPWQRIEQLTEQLNERTAAALTDFAVSDHGVRHGGIVGGRPATAPASRPFSPVPANTRPGSGLRPPGEVNVEPRLTSLGSRRDGADFSRFEVRAAAQFVRERDLSHFASYYERQDGSVGYRYARPVFLNRNCLACHQAVAAEVVETGSVAATRPVGPATGPAADAARAAGLIPLAAVAADTGDGDQRHPLVAIASVDFPSRIDANQVLLNRGFILAAGAMAGVLAIITFYFITTRLILQPVRVLQDTAEKVAKGDLNIRSDISTGDEFQQLSETFNVMLTNLKGSADQLRAMNKTLDLKLGELAGQNVALYESNRLKSEFLANVSHELRTPLNSILGFADLLKDSAIATGADPRNARYVGNILNSGRNLLELINDLLDLAKIEAGRMEVRSEPLSVGDMFEGLANLLKPLLEQKQLTLAITVGPGMPILHTDPVKLQQVLYNFLSNAIKFSPAGQVIDLKAVLEGDVTPTNAPPAPTGVTPRLPTSLLSQIPSLPELTTSPPNGDAADELPSPTPRLPRPGGGSAADEEPHVRITVVDRGPGIAAEAQNVIFEKFRQVDGGHTRTHGGTGLGLAISKELTLLMGGSIGVKSKVGEGATFWVLLPLTIEAGARDVRAKMVMM